MADDEGDTKKAGEAGTDEAAKAAADKLKALLDLLAGEPKPAEEAKSPAPMLVVDELYGGISLSDITDFSKQARVGVERYRNAMRWLIGAVAAIGVLLFGSTAFTEGNVSKSWVPFAWLGLAALGLVLVLQAATLVFEPEDASLGELKNDFSRLPPAKTRNNGGTWWLRLRPRRQATFRLREILDADPTAHLGPDIRDIDGLIDSIASMQGSRREQAKGLSSLRSYVAAETASLAIIDTALKAHGDLAAKFIDKSTPAAKELDLQLTYLASLAANRRWKLLRLHTELSQMQASLLRKDYTLGMNLLHRDLVLNESGLAQLRGTFRQSRRMLFIGSALTLFGTVGYIGTIKAKPDDKDVPRVRAGTMVVQPGNATADEFTGKCLAPVVLSVTYFKEATPKLDEAFEITVSAPEECVDTYKIPSGRSADDITLDLAPAVKVP